VKILHVIASISPTSGGPVEGIMQQNAALLSYGVTREVVSLDLPGASYLKDIPFPVHALGETPGIGAGRYSLSRYGYSSKLIPWLRMNAQSYDRIIVNGLWNYAGYAASRVLRSMNIPYFVFTHGMLDPWFRQQNLIKHFFKQISWLVFEGPMLQDATAVLFTSEEELRCAQGAFWGYADYKKEIAKYGIMPPPPLADFQCASFSAALPALRGRKYLLFMSRIHPKKGCDIIINAFSRIADIYPDIDLVIAGPDQVGWARELQDLTQKMGIAKRVHWPGMLVGDEKWGALRSAEAMLLPSHGENFGVVIAEALSCGTPVLISNRVNIWREVDSVRAGLVCDNTQQAFGATLEAFLKQSDGELSLMRDRAIVCFDKFFNLKNTALELLIILRA